jgi:hypothetical protein
MSNRARQRPPAAMPLDVEPCAPAAARRAFVADLGGRGWWRWPCRRNRWRAPRRLRASVTLRINTAARDRSLDTVVPTGAHLTGNPPMNYYGRMRRPGHGHLLRLTLEASFSHRDEAR